MPFIRRGVKRTLDEVRKAWGERGVDSWASERDGVITLNKIVVPQDARNQGTGTAFMEDLLAYADDTGQTVALTPSTDFGGTKSGLDRFYKRLGFSKNKDYAISEALTRPPASPPQQSLTDTLSGYSDEALRMLQKSALDEGKADEAARYARELDQRGSVGKPRLDPKAPVAAGMAALAAQSEEAEAAPMGTLRDGIKMATRQAYHGSPHDFDKFSLTKIGTGEGAQAYGHGLYFTSKDEIAKYYRDSLSKRRLISRDTGNEVSYQDIKRAAGNQMLANNPNLTAEQVDMYSAAAVDIHAAGASSAGRNPDVKFAHKYLKDHYEFEGTGKLYTVEIPDESNMLDWDKPLSEQPEGVKRILGIPSRDMKAEQALIDKANSLGIDATELPEYRDWEKGIQAINDAERTTGRDFYDSLDMVGSSNADSAHVHAAKDMRAHGYDEEQALEALQSAYPDAEYMELQAAWQESFPGGSKGYVSNKLRELGIPGITYKGATSDERNFVVFDDEHINLIQKGLVDPKLLAPMAAGAATIGYATSEFAAAESSLNATESDLQASSERFKALRKGKRAQRLSQELERVLAPVAGPAKALMDATEVMLVGVAGGIPGYLSELTGYVRGQDLEEAKAGGEALAGKLTGTMAEALGEDWDPQNPYLQGLAKAMEQGEKEFQDAYRMLGVENSVMKKGWDQLPERAQRIITGLADLAL